MLVCSWRTDKRLLLLSHYCVVVVCLMCACGSCGRSLGRGLLVGLIHRPRSPTDCAMD
jgi:hypothetical protein